MKIAAAEQQQQQQQLRQLKEITWIDFLHGVGKRDRHKKARLDNKHDRDFNWPLKLLLIDFWLWHEGLEKIIW